MQRPVSACPGPLSRRHFMQLGALSLASAGSLGVTPYQLRAETGSASADDKAVIFIWLPGGPPHMETYDMKPDAPVEYRGDFKPIQTVVPGMQVCELLPLHAKIADKFTLIRSVAHKFSDHGGGHKRFLTGRDPMSPVGFVNDYPMVGSMVAKVLENRKVGVPNYIAGTDGGRQAIDTFSFGSAYLGPATHPFMVPGDPALPKFQVQNLSLNTLAQERLPERLALLEGLDQVKPTIDQTGTMVGMDKIRKRALELVTTDTAKQAFDITQEPEKLRERYGMHAWGQRALMARRLVEAGATFVTMVLENPYGSGGINNPPKGDGTYNWDSHAVNCHIFRDAQYRFPLYDKVITALVEDLYARGLDEKVLLIVTGEFGRTPKITYAEGRPGRDHWPQAMSMLVAGGGMRTGQVVGSTNAKGEHPKDRPLSPNDLWATMFKHLNIDYDNTSFIDPSGRPMPILPFGEPIRELL